MSKSPEKQKRISFVVRAEDDTEIKIPLKAYSFDATGAVVDSVPVEGDKVDIAMARHGGRVFIAPPIPDDEPLSPARMERRGAFEPALPRELFKVPARLRIPESLLLPWCLCMIRGRVVRNIGGQDMPVCGARVHICEVDPILWWIRRLPELELLKLRDDLLDDLISPLPPKHHRAIRSPVASIVRETLISQVEFIRPILCFHPWWLRLRCDELRVVQTDSQGRFDAFIFYPCTDKPDLYFWVEYLIGGTWTTVHRPPIRCNTHWDYQCGSEVTIHVTDPRVPVCGDTEEVDGCSVAVLSIGHNVSVREVATVGTNEGLTLDGRPFGGSLEPRVWFGRQCLFSKNITKYRWSYRRVGTSAWTIMDALVGRHYVHIDANGDLSFPFATLGPDVDNRFAIKPIDPPNGGDEWFVVNQRTDTASAFFRSDLLAGGNPSLGAGKYEIKLELFHEDGTLVNWTTAGIDILVPEVGETAPFAADTLETEQAPSYYRVLAPNGQTMGFRMVLHVDNNPCHAQIKAVTGNGLSINDCGFVEYVPSAGVTLSFEAAHPNGFATFAFDVTMGLNGSVPAADADGKVGDTSVDGYTLTTTSPQTYSKALAMTDIISDCPSAAFAEVLRVRATATNGWGRLQNLDRWDSAAFALTPATTS